MISFSVILIAAMISPDAAGQSTDLRPGNPAPSFELVAATRDSILREPMALDRMLEGGPLVLAFYPADWSSGCTREMCALRDNFEELKNLGIAVYGISGDYPYSHRKWAKHLELPFTLLSDHRHEVARMYQSFNEETGYTRRTVFVIDADGVIVYMDLSFGSSNSESYSRLYEAVRGLR